MAATCTYRKTKTGKWAVMGPASIIEPGATVTVTKKSGETKSEVIASVGKTFKVDGVPTRYGYPEESNSGGSRRSYNYRGPSGTYECDECGEYVTPGSRCWETGMRH